ncbi:PREDICTED: sterol O-acyltransferase 1 isoform X2 [Vollenhovia emeryi]|uniref:sterol O-acyltransferase 1 isoform X2 n=1 Tax=Vollenhovia emeryi TaxID=411798 RepID=UPI0005F3B2E9|nr:PREDICTED: sterol O-acyltransferase 1 isoform X2 [Vollenhovia emeryi]
MSSVTETVNIKDSGVANKPHEKSKNVANGNAFTEMTTDALREATTNALHKKIEEIREDVLGQVNNRINDMMSEVLKKMETPPEKNGEFLYSTDKYRDKRKLSSQKDTLPVKEFVERNSFLTDLFEIPHIHTVYNLFMVTLILLFFHTATSDFVKSGTVHMGTKTLRIGFAKFSTCIYIWSFMQTLTLGVYVVFSLWAYQRLRFSPKSSIRKFWDYGWLSAFILYVALFLIFPTKAMLNENMSIGCSFIILLEQIRMMMKSHAFVRSVAPRFLSYKPHNETPRPSIPRFSQYLYFLFAPTLVYRDEYPRTKKIRWLVVIRNFIEVGLALFYLAFIAEHFILPMIDVTFGTQQLERKWYVKNIIEASIPGILYFVTGQYLLLHAWLNAWAEMLRFADRLFYKDWWNSTTYHSYYRTWNLVVHDWLHTYIYKDMYEIVMPRNRTLAATAVFFVSAIVHEYIIAFAFGFFYPVMFVLFGGIGFAMFFVRKIITSNLFMWVTWFLGNGVMVSLYSMEFYARYNCPPHSNYYLDLFIPRSWSCQA